MDQTKEVKRTQNNLLLKYLKTHKKEITSWDAFEKLGITRLSARVSDLRKQGNNIETHKQTGVNQYGHICNYARYILIEE